nr:trypsin-like peptidase domain-containing protein [Pseudomonadota bacterium]
TEGVQITRVNPWLNDPFFERFFNFSFPSRSRTVRNVGSGVILDADKGLIVTNHHVLQGADRISVTLKDGRTLEATIIGQDEASDLALISIEAPDLTSIDIAKQGTVRVGDYVVAIGNPFGFSHTVTQGIVSGIGRTSVLKSKQSLIQTDASINPGNSGGALLNFNGKLVGVNTAIYNPTGGGNIGIGFAIPGRTVTRVVNLLERYGEVRRFILGIEGQTVDPGLAEALALPTEKGVIVMQMQSGSDASKFGLRPGDVITAMNAEPITDAANLISRYEYFQPDDRVNLTVRRGKIDLALSGKVGQGNPTKLEGIKINRHLEGLTFSEVEIYEGTNTTRRQVVVLEVSETSSTRRFGITAKDTLSKINEDKIQSLDELKNYTGINQLLIEFTRGSESYRLVIR